MRRLVLLAAVVLSAAACAVGEVPTSWVVSDEESALFLRWTREESGRLSGQLQVAELVGTDVDSQSLGFTGSISDANDVTLDLPQGLGFSTTVTGTVSHDELVLSFPEQTGTLAEVTLTPGDVSDYNEAVQGLHARALEAAEVARQQAVRDEEHRSVAAAYNSAVDDLDSNLSRAESNLSTAEDLIGGAAERMHGTLEEEIALLEDEVASADEEYDYEVSIPYALDVAVRYEFDAVILDLENARSFLVDVEDDLSAAERALNDARDALEGYTSSGFAQPSDAQATISDAEARIASHRSRITDLRTQADEIEAEARDRWSYAVEVAARAGVEPEEP